MIEQKTALRHLESFRQSNLDFPPDADGLKALAKMLAKCALSSEHAGAVVATWISHWPKWPRPADLRSLCDTTADPQAAHAAAQRDSCSRCHGTGYIQTDGPFGLTGAYPCSHQPETEADQRMGVSISPAMAKRYIAEQAEARKRQVAFLQRRADGKVLGFSRVDQSDVDALMDSIGEPA